MATTGKRIPKPIYPLLPKVEQSSIQAFYFFMNATIDGEYLSRNDWIGAFRNGYCSNPAYITKDICEHPALDGEWYSGEICVGVRKWGDCRRGTPCDVPAMGYDASNDNTIGYMTPGVIPYFKMYDASSGKYIKVKPLENYPWENNGIFEVKMIINAISIEDKE
jgi:hypothetical protein